jgi:hypothetical protein
MQCERRQSWRYGIRQTLAYSVQVGLPPAIALFGAIHCDDLPKLYLKLRGDPYRSNANAIALWWWAPVAQHCARGGSSG